MVLLVLTVGLWVGLSGIYTSMSALVGSLDATSQLDCIFSAFEDLKIEVLAAPVKDDASINPVLTTGASIHSCTRFSTR